MKEKSRYGIWKDVYRKEERYRGVEQNIYVNKFVNNALIIDVWIDGEPWRILVTFFYTV